MKLRLGTRGSDLARTQASWVARELEKSGLETELVVISTSGDRSTAPSFGSIGPQGVFVREIEQALIEGDVDIAVHSFKDLPTRSPDGLVIAAVPPRRDPADWLFVRKSLAADTDGAEPESGLTQPEPERGLTPTERGLTPFRLLPEGAKVGTSSARRQSWLRYFRPDLDVQPLRGNVPTRLRRLADGDYDAILLAGAGVERLAEASGVLDGALAEVGRSRLDPYAFVPAPAQGALAVQCRADDPRVLDSVAAIDDAATRVAVDLERRALALAEAGCDAAFGAFARAEGDGFELMVMSEIDGRIESAAVKGRGKRDLAFEAMQRLQARAGGAQ
jgi:hydroxymethylbilane synthase